MPSLCEIKVFHYYFSLLRRPSDIILFILIYFGNLPEIILKLFQRIVAAREYGIIQHTRCR